MHEKGFPEILDGRRVLFITPSNIGYIRNKQEKTLLEKRALRVDVIAPKDTRDVTPTSVFRVLGIAFRVLLRGAGDCDAVFIGGLPQLIVPFTLFLFRKKPLIIDFFISLYDTLVCDRNAFSPRNPLSALLRALDRFTLARADRVIVDTAEHARYFAREFGVDARKMSVLYLEADPDIYYPRVVPRPEDLKDKFIVFFFGAMNPLQGVDVIFRSAQLLKGEKNIQFVIVGPVDKTADARLVSDMSNVRIAADWLPQTEIAQLIATADVCLAGHFSAEIPKARRVIPGKAYAYLAMDKPVILGDNPANRELFSEGFRNIHFVTMGDPEALAELIRRLGAAREQARGAAQPASPEGTQ
ncbi:MAG: glycosyltransferase [Desulfobacteraceae bacterium]|nr:glycosyltransferase [Desulfobacteraceae bacterium]